MLDGENGGGEVRHGPAQVLGPSPLEISVPPREGEERVSDDREVAQLGDPRHHFVADSARDEEERGDDAHPAVGADLPQPHRQPDPQTGMEEQVQRMHDLGAPVERHGQGVEHDLIEWVEVPGRIREERIPQPMGIRPHEPDAIADEIETKRRVVERHGQGEASQGEQ